MSSLAELAEFERLWIGGAWSPPVEARTFEDLRPLDSQVYARVACGGVADIDRAVAAAKLAFASYRQTLAKDREAWLMEAAHLLARRKSQFMDVLIDEIGSPLKKAEFEFGKALSMLRAASGMARQAKGEVIPSDHPGRVSLSMRQPVGVVAAITPFNVPLIKGVRLTANPLALGNTVVLLPSEEAPVIAMMLADLYAEAGIPQGAFNVVTGFGHEIGDALTGHPDVSMVTFTGSSRVGAHIQRICAERNKRVTLELGGKSPMVVLADADLDKAVAAAIHGIFTFQGQVCMGNSRIYVERPVFDGFVSAFASATKRLGMGDLRDPQTTIGPIISMRQRERVRHHIADAIDKGATLLTGGNWDGNRCQPTILTGVTEDMVCCKEETFGPVVSVYPVDSYEEALRCANDTRYGLSSAIFTRNLERAMHFAQHVGAAMCHINASALQDEPHVPFGGNGASGMGREGTHADIEAMTELKWITINH
jgi:acyl-CoA reductase-like NAD-dependent aldehyde dehydrogenase